MAKQDDSFEDDEVLYNFAIASCIVNIVATCGTVAVRKRKKLFTYLSKIMHTLVTQLLLKQFF